MSPFPVAAFICVISLVNGASPPTWGKSYIVEGLLQLPYAEIKEPFMAFYSENLNMSRIDYYAGLVETYQYGASKGNFGSAKKVAYVSNDTVLNVKDCFLSNGTENNTYTIQSILPDLTGFKLIGTDDFDGESCNVWQKIEMKELKKNTYTMYVTKNGNKPKRYEMMGYDTLLGSHYDKYYLDYTNYKLTQLKPDKFKVSMPCSGFPGPGVEESITMNPMQEYISHDDSHTHDMFNHFKAKHDKKYKNQQEHEERKHIFRQNVRFISSKNRQALGFTLAVNHLADHSDEEMKVMNGYRHTPGYNGGLAFHKEHYRMSDVPDQMDWRLYGAVTPVKDQAVCGSCWSFGTSGTVEGAHFIKTGRLVRLSQQELMDCSWGEGNNACDGGEDFRSYQWMMKHGGLTSEDQYGPYLAQDSKCMEKNVTPVAVIKGYVNVTAYDRDALRAAIANHGPVSVSIDASHKSLSFYSNGVYYEPSCGSKPDDLDHSVLAVGYGYMQGQPYWLIKNSWSTYWGNAGYVLMSQKNNNCGVATAPTFVLM